MHAANVTLTDLIPSADPPPQRFSLSNGFTVHLQQDKRSPLVCLQMIYHVGSSHEAAGHTNLSHVLEHMVFEGSAKLAAGQYLRIIDWLGGSSSAQTLQDATVYKMVLPASRLEVALEILADTLSHARLSEEAFETARSAVRDERRLKIDNRPVQQAVERHYRLAHGSSPYATPSYGQPDDLDGMSLVSLRTWYRNRYAPNNATLVVVGDVQPEQLQAWVERHFAAAEAVPLAPAHVPRHPAALLERSQIVTLPGLRDGLLMAFNVPSLATSASPTQVHALRIVAELLGRGASSRLHDRLVRSRPVLTGVDPSYDYQLRGDSLINFASFVAPGHTPAAASEAAWEVIAELGRTPVDVRQIEDAKFHLLAQHAAAWSSLTGQADAMGWSVISGVGPDRLKENLHILASLTQDDIQHAIATYLTRERLTVTHLQAPPTPVVVAPVLTCADLGGAAEAVDLSGLSAAQGLEHTELSSTGRPVLQWRSASGSSLCFVASEGAPVFDLQLRFNAGACQDGETPGLAALTLYLLDQGCDELDAAQVAARMNALGMTFSRSIDHDYALLRLRGPAQPELREAAIALLTALAARPSFEAAALERMRTRVLNYLARREAKAQNRLNVETLRSLYAPHPYTQDAHGTRDSLATLAREQLIAFHQRAYSAGNLHITLVADLPADQAQALAMAVEQALAASSEVLANAPRAIPLGRPIDLHFETAAGQAEGTNVTVTLTYAVEIASDDPRYPALLMVNQLLGGSFQSRLIGELRQRRGLTYGIRSSLHHYQAATVLTIAWDIEPQYREASLALVRLILGCFIEQGPGAAELDLARNQLVGAMLRRQADDEQLATWLGRNPARGTDSAARFAQVGAEQVQAVARQALEAQRCVTLCLGPKVAQQPLPTPTAASR
ncbi:insulinase family protein [Pseudomonas sp. S75]|uniref:M16 family metallopeptidase n=1 Tax=unclassified Pseudomonas TaxID=196821 RepID=UPI001908132E|nr:MULTISPECIES: pitrilysin family protein [unclassified Pseudomonas]MBJ9977983.1 insulinase family protein [Pseudomonas sp. S30]MBK0155727.1 insulinase family protein [Pseudomonas sp. S75]